MCVCIYIYIYVWYLEKWYWRIYLQGTRKTKTIAPDPGPKIDPYHWWFHTYQPLQHSLWFAGAQDWGTASSQEGCRRAQHPRGLASHLHHCPSNPWKQLVCALALYYTVKQNWHLWGKKNSTSFADFLIKWKNKYEVLQLVPVTFVINIQEMPIIYLKSFCNWAALFLLFRKSSIFAKFSYLIMTWYDKILGW